MTRSRQPSLRTLASRAALSAMLATGVSFACAAETLSGKQEVPPVETSATGTSNVMIKDDRSVSGSVSTSGVQGTMAHIHQGAMGKNGPPIVTLEKGADGKWSVPANSKLTDEQYKAFQAGDLYVNVHSDKHKNGEIRAQLNP